MRPGFRGIDEADVRFRLLDWILDFVTARRVEVTGDSMAPAIYAGSRLVVSARAYRRARPARFDVVMLRSPDAGGREDLKRIVGLPEEHVLLDAGRLFVDGTEITEPHLGRSAGNADSNRHEWRTDPDEYVVLGDNRAHSTDSRSYGPVSRQRIVGRVVRRF